MDPMLSFPRPPAYAAGPAQRAMDRLERGPVARFERGDRVDRGPADRSDHRRATERGADRRETPGERAAAARERAGAGRAKLADRGDRGVRAPGADRGEHPAFDAALDRARAALETTTGAGPDLASVVEETLTTLDVDTDTDHLRAIGWPLTLLAAAQQAQGAQVDAEGLVAALEDTEAGALLRELSDGAAAAVLGEVDEPARLVAEAEAMLADLAADVAAVDEQRLLVGEEAVEDGVPAGSGDAADLAEGAGAAAAATAAASPSTEDVARVGPPRAERADARAATHPTPPGQQVRTEPLTGSESRVAGVGGELLQTMETPRGEPPRSPQLPAGVQRVLELVAQLEKMPPPRQLVLDLGDLRLRVGMEDGQVKLTVLKGEGRAAEELLSDARDALAEQGFDLAGDGGAEQGDGDDRHDGGPDRRAPGPVPSRRRPADTGLRL